jgi:hypothetical protein
VSGATIGSLERPVSAILGGAAGILIDIFGGMFKSGNCDGVVAADTITYKTSNIGTSDAPALVAYKDRLYMAWKGIGNDMGMWFSSTQV